MSINISPKGRRAVTENGLDSKVRNKTTKQVKQRASKNPYHSSKRVGGVILNVLNAFA